MHIEQRIWLEVIRVEPHRIGEAFFQRTDSDSTIVFVTDGVPCLSCKHNACSEGAA